MSQETTMDGGRKILQVVRREETFSFFHSSNSNINWTVFMSCAIWTKLNFNSTASAHIIDFQNENFQFGILAKNFLPRPPFAGCEHCAFFLLLLLHSLLLHWSSPRDSTFAFLFAGLCDVSSQPTEGKLRWEKLLTKLLYENRPLVVLCGWEKRRDERDGREREELVAEVRSCLALYVLKLTIFFLRTMEGKNMVGVWRENENVKLDFWLAGKARTRCRRKEKVGWEKVWAFGNVRARRATVERRGKCCEFSRINETKAG